MEELITLLNNSIIRLENAKQDVLKKITRSAIRRHYCTLEGRPLRAQG